MVQKWPPFSMSAAARPGVRVALWAIPHYISENIHCCHASSQCEKQMPLSVEPRSHGSCGVLAGACVSELSARDCPTRSQVSVVRELPPPDTMAAARSRVATSAPPASSLTAAAVSRIKQLVSVVDGVYGAEAASSSRRGDVGEAKAAEVATALHHLLLAVEGSPSHVASVCRVTNLNRAVARVVAHTAPTTHTHAQEVCGAALRLMVRAFVACVVCLAGTTALVTYCAVPCLCRSRVRCALRRCLQTTISSMVAQAAPSGR